MRVKPGAIAAILAEAGLIAALYDMNEWLFLKLLLITQISTVAMFLPFERKNFLLTQTPTKKIMSSIVLLITSLFCFGIYHEGKAGPYAINMWDTVGRALLSTHRDLMVVMVIFFISVTMSAVVIFRGAKR